MDIQTLKLDLVSKIIDTEKPELLMEISRLIQQDKKNDWWDELPEEVQKSIFEGMTDVQNGNVFTHEQIVQEVKQKYGF
ncbi:MAG: hypothetical protein ACQETJ_00645 [Bacteroidota bacterium]